MKKIESIAKDLGARKSLPRVLYVEDNDDNWHVTQLRLGRSYELVRATNDRAACEVLSQPAKLYAILMDVELGGSRLNGIQLTKLIRGTLPVEGLPEYARHVPLLEIPVLFVTAYGDAYPRADLLACGADDVLGKPVNFTRMNLALANLYIKRVLVR
ncbi:MAG TPA: response regulator [Polyangiaceae bacterium]|jgi:CheY-like chemotaxis protein|nr:response regulator [Polyangiaceae bacterium]